MGTINACVYVQRAACHGMTIVAISAQNDLSLHRLSGELKDCEALCGFFERIVHPGLTPGLWWLAATYVAGYPARALSLLRRQLELWAHNGRCGTITYL